MIPASYEKRLWNKIDCKSDQECWLWQGPLNERGHGYMSVNNQCYYVHRLVWELTRGQRLQRLTWIERTCGNNDCCNPRHLRVKAHRGAGHPNSKLIEGDIPQIYNLYMSGQSMSKLASRFNVSKTAIKKVLQRHTWKHVNIG